MKKLILCSLFVILTNCTAAPTAPSAPAVNSVAQEKGQAEAAPKVETSEEAKNTKTMKGKAKSCICAKIWMPVCGENKKTYGNSCEADCAGVKYTVGACEESK